jgi:hypothetical protein
MWPSSTGSSVLLMNALKSAPVGRDLEHNILEIKNMSVWHDAAASAMLTATTATNPPGVVPPNVLRSDWSVKCAVTEYMFFIN